MDNNVDLWDVGFTRIPNRLSDMLTPHEGLAVCVFFVLLLEARRQSCIEDTQLKRGEVMVKVRTIASLIGVSYYKVRSALIYLNELGLVKNKIANPVKNRFTLVTICEYDRYNGVFDDCQKVSQKLNRKPFIISKNYSRNIKKENIKRKKADLPTSQPSLADAAPASRSDLSGTAENAALDADALCDEMERRYLHNMLEHFPRIMKMKKPLQYAEYKKLVEKHGKDAVDKMILHLENYARIDRYVSAYLTINNWM